MAQCGNCGTPLQGAYCPSCGQKDVDLERPLRDLLGEVINETFDLDGRAFRTIKILFLAPGRLTSEFLAGRRRSYTPPLRLYLVISVSFFILVAWLASRGVLLDEGQDLAEDAPVQARFMSEELPRLMFVLLPVFAFLLKLAWWRRLYFDHVICSVHLHSAAYVVLGLMLPMEQAASGHWLPLAAQIVLLTYFVAYIVVSLRHVYRASWLGAGLKTAAVLLGYLVVVSGVIEASSNFLILTD